MGEVFFVDVFVEDVACQPGAVVAPVFQAFEALCILRCRTLFNEFCGWLFGGCWLLGWMSADAAWIEEDLPVAFANGSLPPRDELPLINVQAALKPGLWFWRSWAPPGAKSGVKCAWWGCFWADQVRKQAKSVPGHNIQKTRISSNATYITTYRIIHLISL